MVFKDDDYNSDDEVNEKQHSQLLDEVFQLDKRQYVKKPSRTEPTTHVSEFNLVKLSSGRKSTVNVNDLTKSLEQKSKHVQISNKIKAAKSKTTLRKPLEKPQAEKIRRTVGFHKVRDELGKWDSIIERNKVATQLIFPLNQGEITIDKGKKRKRGFDLRIKSELEKELEKLEPVVETVEVEEKFPLSMEEIVERRKEMARLRAHQSYQEAKAYRKNKIKSKKFHRIQRKEKIKQQIKEFELLKTTDPEEALRKLEELEKTRAEERMSLRHRSTGQWAKNKQVRAKYDRESRQALSQQLAISRELTQKNTADESSESETEETLPKKPSDPSNPWLTVTPEVDEFYSGYRKYWTEKNKMAEKTAEDEFKNDLANLANNSQHEETQTEESVKTKNKKSDARKKRANSEDLQENGVLVKKTKKKNNKSEATNSKEAKVTKKTKSVVHCNSSWTVTPTEEEEEEEEESASKYNNVEDLFEDLESEARNKLQSKLSNLKSPKKQKQKKVEVKQKKEYKKADLSMPRERLRPEVDEELGEDEEVEEEDDFEKLKKTADSINTQEPQKQLNKKLQNVDPSNFMTVKPVDLPTVLPDIALGDDNEEENDQRAFIAEAFEDDDVVAEFNKEKKDIIDSETPKDINLTLPGWGSWGGKNIKPSKRKRKRFIVKMPKEMPRRDENRGNLIINEKKDAKIKKHLVTELPFPFKSVKDYEASIRAPIGDTFIPHTAFKRLIKPAVVTKKGAVIEPMSDDLLLRQKFTNNGMVIIK